MDTYIVAVKRQAREQVEEDWADAIEKLDGVELAPDAVNPNRRQVKATEEGIEAVKEALDTTHHVEKVVEHRPTPSGLPGIGA